MTGSGTTAWRNRSGTLRSLCGVAAAMGVALITPVTVAAEPISSSRSFVGYAYDLKQQVLVYKEYHHVSVQAGGSTELRTEYVGPAGGAIAAREVDFSADLLAPTFRLDDNRAGYSEGLLRDGGDMTVFHKLADREDQERRKLSRSGELLVADAGFDRLITTQWERLAAGEKLRTDFLVPSRLRTLRFIVTREKDWVLEGEPVVTFRMTSANPLLRLLIGAIRVTYHERERFLMRYVGFSNIKDVDGGIMTVRIDFPLDERSDWRPADDRMTKVARYDDPQ